MDIHERSHDDEYSKSVPAPESLAAELYLDVPVFKLRSDPVAHGVEPDKARNAAGDQGEQEIQIVAHGFLMVMPAGDGVEVIAESGKEYEGVNAQCADGQEHELGKASLCQDGSAGFGGIGYGGGADVCSCFHDCILLFLLSNVSMMNSGICTLIDFC